MLEALTKRQILESHINFFGLTWEVVERHYPNYSSCDSILLLDILTRFLDGEEVDTEDLSYIDGFGGDPRTLYINTYQDILDKTFYKVKALAPMGKDYIPEGVQLDHISLYEITKCILPKFDFNVLGQKIDIFITRQGKGFVIQAGTHMTEKVISYLKSVQYYVPPKASHKQVIEIIYIIVEQFINSIVKHSFTFEGKTLYKSNLEVENVEC